MSIFYLSLDTFFCDHRQCLAVYCFSKFVLNSYYRKRIFQKQRNRNVFSWNCNFFSRRLFFRFTNSIQMFWIITFENFTINWISKRCIKNMRKIEFVFCFFFFITVIIKKVRRCFERSSWTKMRSIWQKSWMRQRMKFSILKIKRFWKNLLIRQQRCSNNHWFENDFNFCSNEKKWKLQNKITFYLFVNEIFKYHRKVLISNRVELIFS